MKKIIIICLLAIILFLGVTYLKFFLETRNRVVLDLNYVESANTIRNPERGWYLITGCMVTDNDDSGLLFYENFKKQHNDGDTLCLILFNLVKYRDGAISEKGLNYIENVLKGIRQSGLKAIIRFVYDWDGKGLEKEPENIYIVLNHMEQLKKPLNEYKDIIYLIQGLFVGSYGEMHNSKHLGEEDMAILMNKLLQCVHPTTKLSVRTPRFWRVLLKSTEPVRNFSELPGSRIGLYNDGLCSSISDLGTYSDGTGKINLEYSNK